jgi:hypothetical protein
MKTELVRIGNSHEARASNLINVRKEKRSPLVYFSAVPLLHTSRPAGQHRPLFRPLPQIRNLFRPRN